MPMQTLAGNAIGCFDGLVIIKQDAKIKSELAPREAQAERLSAVTEVGSEQFFFTVRGRINVNRLQSAVGMPKRIRKPYALLIISRI